MNEASLQLPPAVRRQIERLAELWALPELPARVTVRFSARMSRAWGRCYPARGLVTLNPLLRTEAKRHLREVLCHELAHVAVYLVHGARARPHGAEWRALVERAGQTARLRLCAPGEAEGLEPQTRPVVRRWEHRCPVCQMVRTARRKVPGWRCAECRRAGLEGRLEIRAV